MKRDMELVRKILFAIEEQYEDTVLYNLKIEGYSRAEVAYHCKILHEAGFVSDYGAQYGGNHIYMFGVGALTWERCEFLDKVRQDTVWNKTRDIITQKGLPMILDVVKDVASTVIASMTEGAIKALSN